MSISVIIPAYNEEQIIGATIDTVYRFLADNYDKYQIVVVNDGSTDDTLGEISKFPYVTCVSYEDRHGKGYALKKGVEKAWGDFIVLYDADMAYSAEYIIKAHKLLTHFDIVAGTRDGIMRKDYSPIRQQLSKGFSKYVDRNLNLGISDTQCGFKVLRSTVAKRIFPLAQLNGFAFDVEIFALAKKYGYTVAEMPVSVCEEVRPSRVNPIIDGLGMAGDVQKIKTRLRSM
ncbi:MAG: glycosyltransferase [Eubacteriales bacterium]|nr:glycosyltransferase [Eubacteriales bacterium]